MEALFAVERLLFARVLAASRPLQPLYRMFPCVPSSKKMVVTKLRPRGLKAEGPNGVRGCEWPLEQKCARTTCQQPRLQFTSFPSLDVTSKAITSSSVPLRFSSPYFTNGPSHKVLRRNTDRGTDGIKYVTPKRIIFAM